MDALLAATPILLVLFLMVGRRWPASQAGVAGVALALLLALTVFELGDGVPTGAALGGTLAEAAFTSASILWIIVPALAIHHLQVASGATEVLRDALGRLSADPRILALLIGWFFALFAEGAAGFGASVALAAPFLVGVGYPALEAVTVAMLGHAIGVSFGAIGTPVLPQVAATGLDPTAISRVTATYHLLLGWTLIVVLVVVASRATGRAPRGAIWGWALLAGASFLIPYWLLAAYVGPELPTLAGSLVGAALFVGMLRLAGRAEWVAAVHPTRPAPLRLARAALPLDHRYRWAAGVASDPIPAEADDAPPSAARLLRAGAPYLVLVGLVLATRLVPPLRDALGVVVLSWELDGGFSGSLAPLTHPGTLLAVSFVAGAAVQRTAGRARGALATTAGQMGPVVLALVGMLTVARLMVHAGMTDALAVAASSSAGAAWPVLAPLVGVLGTFVTGSATASNVLFTDLQVATATALGLSVLPLVGLQGFGAAIGNIVCPHNIVAAGATVGLTGGEGAVLRRTLGVAIGYAALGGVLALVVVLPLAG